MQGRDALNAQRLWGWKVALHLFLVGMGAGIYLAGILQGMVINASGLVPGSRVAVTAAVLVVAGMICIFSHMGYKPNVLKAFVRVSSSWLARGSVITVVFLILVLIHAVILFRSHSPLQTLAGVNLLLGVVTSVFALLVLIYSGMVLKALKPFAFWNTWLLPLLFVISGISIGIMALAFLMSAFPPFAGRAAALTFRVLFYSNNLAIIIQAAVLGLYLRRSYSSSVNSFLIITRGYHAATFWVGVVAAGLVVPFVFGVYFLSGTAGVSGVNPVWLFLCTGIGIIGGYPLRYSILSAGTTMPVNVQGEMVPLPADARIPASRRVNYHPG
ncbi:MAG: polysulfide reductase NrfD [Deltaproteobacteria bacterium]|nr:polysulfide reductase NrfD [Deltaproteobacteria bacterium]